MIMTTRVRAKEALGYRMTPKRKEAIALAESQGIQFNTDIFRNPLTQSMSVDELIEFSKQSLQAVNDAHSPAFVNTLLNHRALVNEGNIEQEVKTFEEIEHEVVERFKLMDEIVLSTAMGINPALYLSGSAGVGKSTTVLNTIESLGITNYELIKGNVTALGLYILLYKHRAEGSLIVFDDADSVFDDEDKLNIIKSATDSSDIRRITWTSAKYNIVDEDDNTVPQNFNFKGTIIFLTNKDIYKEAKGTSKMAKHYEALVSRSFVLDLTLRTEEHYMARIRDVLFNAMDEKKYKQSTKETIYNFMWDNRKNLRELSLRMVGKINILMQTYNDNWESKAKILLCR